MDDIIHTCKCVLLEIYVWLHISSALIAFGHEVDLIPTNVQGWTVQNVHLLLKISCQFRYVVDLQSSQPTASYVTNLMQQEQADRTHHNTCTHSGCETVDPTESIVTHCTTWGAFK